MSEPQANRSKNFSLIGVAGYIAIRHVRAIKDTGNNLVAALDKFDSVGFLDSFFPEADFFTEFERYDRHIEMMKRKGTQIDYVSICSPNYLHDSHIRFALRVGAHAICEKPIVLNPWNVEALEQMEKENGLHIYTILQLRLHPVIIELKKKIETAPADKIYDIDLTYITSRGKWYFYSWKGDLSKSGGIATNIGVHFFDMLSWIFGDVVESIVHVSNPDTASGLLRLKKANVRWFLSVDENMLPPAVREKKQRTFRNITIDNESVEFSEGFTDLHTESYKSILAGKGFRIGEAKNSIATVYDIRHALPLGIKGNYHPFCKLNH